MAPRRASGSQTVPERGSAESPRVPLDPGLDVEARARPHPLGEPAGEGLTSSCSHLLRQVDLGHHHLGVGHRHRQAAWRRRSPQRRQGAARRLVEVAGRHPLLEQGVDQGSLQERIVQVAGHPRQDAHRALRHRETLNGLRLRCGLRHLGHQAGHRLDQLLRPEVLAQEGVGAGAQAPEAGGRLGAGWRGRGPGCGRSPDRP